MKKPYSWPMTLSGGVKMKIREFKCTQFGGLRNKRIELQDGLNVVLGPNEAGKSTLVEGMYATLFKQPKLSKKGIDLEFSNRFMPKPEGDFMDGTLMLEKASKQYEIAKSWGSSPQARIALPNDSVIQDAAKVDESIRNILNFGERTYSNVIFSKQQDLKKALELILKDNETTSDLSTVLRKVVMNLDGVSIDDLKRKINEEYKELFERWNPRAERPESPGQRYKKNVGLLLQKHYDIEDLQKKINDAKAIENQINGVAAELKGFEEKRTNTKREIEKFSQVEQDVLKRAQIEPKLEQLREKEVTLKKIAYQWPQSKEMLKSLEKELTQIQSNIAILEEQSKSVKMLNEKEKLAKTIAKIDGINAGISKIETELLTLPKITKEEILKMEELRSSILTAETAIKAGKMQGTILQEGKAIWITKDFEEKQEYKVGQFSANGYLKIEFEDVALEIQSGEFDFTELKASLMAAQNQLGDKLTSLKIKTIEEGKLIKEKLEKHAREIEGLNKELKALLDGQSYEELKLKLQELEHIRIDKSLDQIDEEMKLARHKQMERTAEHLSIKNSVSEWEQLYKEPGNIFDVLGDNKAEAKVLEGELAKLDPLPTGFNSTEEFSNHLRSLRVEAENYQKRYEQVKDSYNQLEKQLPESSTEELEQDLKTIQAEYSQLIKKGRSLLKVIEVFQKKLEEMDQNSFQPLVKSFSKYLSELTLNNYQTAQIDDSFNVDIQKGDVPMPHELLSTGTKDCVALALRFAIIEVLYGENPGIIILDDCLVDLDPQRKEKAIELIQKFAHKNQVIFTTCNPQTANELGGNIINL